MATKLTITIEADKENPPDATAINQTAALLYHLTEGAPMQKLTLNFDFADRDEAEEAEEEIEMVLAARPAGVNVKFVTKSERQASRARALASVTPMDEGGWAEAV